VRARLDCAPLAFLSFFRFLSFSACSSTATSLRAPKTNLGRTGTASSRCSSARWMKKPNTQQLLVPKVATTSQFLLRLSVLAHLFRQGEVVVVVVVAIQGECRGMQQQQRPWLQQWQELQLRKELLPLVPQERPQVLLRCQCRSRDEDQLLLQQKLHLVLQPFQPLQHQHQRT